jgi:Tol biopolymer transport system component
VANRCASHLPLSRVAGLVLLALASACAGDHPPDQMPRSQADPRHGIFIVAAEGGEPKWLASGTNPRWSPDGRRIAFETDRDGNPEVYVMRPNGSHQTNITNHAAKDQDPVWSPDGRRIAFVSDRDGVYEVYVTDPKGREATRVTHGPTGSLYSDSCSWLSWSGDPTRIVFYRDDDIWMAGLDGSEAVNLTSDLRRDDGSRASPSPPEWSPDGSSIAFVASPGYRRCVYTMPPDGSRKRCLTRHLTGDAEWPTWSPDGARLAFLLTTGYTALWAMDADGRHARELTEASPNGKDYCWSPDCEELVYLWKGNLWIINVGSGDRRQLTSLGWGTERPSWSPTGKWVAFWHYAGSWAPTP